jgi:hypothetical protein
VNSISEIVHNLWISGRKTRQTLAGWIAGNAPCCHHRGERPDTKSRGGLMMTDGGFSWHCFNCGFKAGYSQGRPLSKNCRDLMKWLGLNWEEIQRLALISLKEKDSSIAAIQNTDLNLETRSLPDNCLGIDQWLEQGCQDPDLVAVIDYVVNVRGMQWNWYNWHWSPAAGFKNRVILPFYHQGKTVGWTARKITDRGQPRYLTDSQRGYVFNLDRQQYTDRSFLILVEGQFDAIAVDAAAIMTNEPNDVQCRRIQNLGKPVIAVPDADAAGARIINTALEQGWSVSVPPWTEHYKDAAAAVKALGRPYVLWSIVHHATDQGLKLQLLQKKLEKLVNNESKS